MNVKQSIKQNPFLTASFIFALSVFFIQHASGVSWDFSAYVLNARYYLGLGNYFEWLRPPLTSILIAFFGAGLFAEYAFILVVAVLHLFSSVKLAKKLKLNPSLFYLLSLTPFTIAYSFRAGSELLSLALIQLLIAYSSGFGLGLAMLTRYTNAAYSVLLFFNNKFKKALEQLLIAALIFAPWLLFNFVAKGDPFFGIVNQYANNIGLRGYAWKPFNFFHFLEAANYLLPLFILGLFVTFKKRKFSKYDLIMLFIFIYELYSYYKIPLKLPRYLFLLTIPLAYFSAKFFKVHHLDKIALPFVLVLNIVLIPLCINLIVLEPVSAYSSAFDSINNSCMVQSNAWVFLNYFRINSEPYPHEGLVGTRIEQGYQIVLFRNQGEPEYVLNDSFLSQFPVITNQSRFIILWDNTKCVEPYTYDTSYLEGLNRTFYDLYGYEFTYTIWDVFKQ